MVSLYDALADSCAALAAKAKRQSDKLRLLQLADQWRTFLQTAKDPAKSRRRRLPPQMIARTW
jgi:hypothetical protein